MEKYRGVRTEEGKGKYRWEINKILVPVGRDFYLQKNLKKNRN